MHLKYSLKEGKNLIGLCPKIPVAYGRVKMVHEAAFFCSGVNWPSLHKDKDHKGVALIGQFMVHGARFPQTVGAVFRPQQRRNCSQET